MSHPTQPADDPRISAVLAYDIGVKCFGEVMMKELAVQAIVFVQLNPSPEYAVQVAQYNLEIAKAAAQRRSDIQARKTAELLGEPTPAVPPSSVLSASSVVQKESAVPQ